MTDPILVSDLRLILLDLRDEWAVQGQADGSLALVAADGTRVGTLAGQAPPPYDPATEVPPLAVRIDLITDRPSQEGQSV